MTQAEFVQALGAELHLRGATSERAALRALVASSVRIARPVNLLAC
jgi:hypothetical protein